MNFKKKWAESNPWERSTGREQPDPVESESNRTNRRPCLFTNHFPRIFLSYWKRINRGHSTPKVNNKPGIFCKHAPVGKTSSNTASNTAPRWGGGPKKSEFSSFPGRKKIVCPGDGNRQHKKTSTFLGRQKFFCSRLCNQWLPRFSRGKNSLFSGNKVRKNNICSAKKGRMKSFVYLCLLGRVGEKGRKLGQVEPRRGQKRGRGVESSGLAGPDPEGSSPVSLIDD